MESISCSFSEFWGNYGLFVWAGLMGSVAYCVQKRELGLRGIIEHVLRSMFVGALVGITVRELTDISNDLVFVVTAASCYFSTALLKEVREIISKISDYVDKKLN